MGSSGPWSRRYDSFLHVVLLSCLTFADFALQITACMDQCNAFMPDVDDSASKLYACCQTLLRMSPGDFVMLEPAVVTLSGVTATISILMRHRQLFNTKMEQMFVTIFLGAIDIAIGIATCFQAHALNCNPGMTCPYRTACSEFTRQKDGRFRPSCRMILSSLS